MSNLYSTRRKLGERRCKILSRLCADVCKAKLFSALTARGRRHNHPKQKIHKNAGKCRAQNGNDNIQNPHHVGRPAEPFGETAANTGDHFIAGFSEGHINLTLLVIYKALTGRSNSFYFSNQKTLLRPVNYIFKLS